MLVLKNCLSLFIRQLAFDGCLDGFEIVCLVPLCFVAVALQTEQQLTLESI
jgi:hypothetical protein